MEQILTTTATLERGYLASQGNDLSVFDEQIIRLGQLFRLWQECAEDFRKALNADERVMPMQRDYVHEELIRIADQLMDLQTKTQIHRK
jgi:hypothetical protein